MTVEELQGRMSSREFSKWLAYYGEWPFGDERADLRSGIVASTVATGLSAKKKRFRPSDFMPILNRDHGRSKQSPGHIRRIFEMITGTKATPVEEEI